MVIAIINKSNNVVEEFRNGDNVTLAVATFCNEYKIPLDVADYTGLDVVSSVPARGKKFEYDPQGDRLIEVDLPEPPLETEEIAKHSAAVDARTLDILATANSIADVRRIASDGAALKTSARAAKTRTELAAVIDERIS